LRYETAHPASAKRGLAWARASSAQSLITEDDEDGVRNHEEETYLRLKDSSMSPGAEVGEEVSDSVTEDSEAHASAKREAVSGRFEAAKRLATHMRVRERVTRSS
jgi:hypothetical protein